MRTVTVFENVRNTETKKHELIPVNKGVFHGWGLDVEEGESGFASYSVAIVELSDGKIITPAAHLVQFNK